MHTFPSLLYTLDSPCPTCAHLCPCFPPLFRLTKTRSGWVLGTGSICSGGGRNKDKESRILSNIEVRPSEARDWRLPRCFPSLVSSTKGAEGWVAILQHSFCLGCILTNSLVIYKITCLKIRKPAYFEHYFLGLCFVLIKKSLPHHIIQPDYGFTPLYSSQFLPTPLSSRPTTHLPHI